MKIYSTMSELKGIVDINDVTGTKIAGILICMFGLYLMNK